MGRKSVKENKTVYQQAREQMNLTREAASELLGYISADRIEKIENEKTVARPEEVLTMAQCYKRPELCNYYCSRECPIGIDTVPELKLKDLSQITLEVLATLNALDKEKDRLVEITVDGEITEDEKKDFEAIRVKLSEMAVAINSLSLWVDSAVHNGNIED
jgi:transcriptional regulator with XRE-family HTH domain